MVNLGGGITKARKNFRCVLINDAGDHLSTSIRIIVPDGLTRKEAVDWVAKKIAEEVSRYAAWEALDFGPVFPYTNWDEKVT